MQKLEVSGPEAQSADQVAGNIEQLNALFHELISEGGNGAAVNADILKARVVDRHGQDLRLTAISPSIRNEPALEADQR